tara:strand:+ start:2266 stop:2772 length:507 start_codon:yes stop_codon:yes gene_type:complete
MSLSMSQVAVPTLLRALANLQAVLGKAAAHCAEKKIDPSALVSFRLYPDMLPLSAQVQIATDMSKGCVARLAGIDAPKFVDDENSFEQLQARIDKTIAFIKDVDLSAIDGTEDKPIVMKTPRGELKFTGQNYLMNFVQPNVYFHATTVYNILRHNGVVLGKMDFLGRP